MTNAMSRYVQLDNWIFEVKTVRALHVDSYGKPYSAIANLNLHGDNAFIDGLMTRDNEGFTEKDFQVFEKVCQQLGINQMTVSKSNKLEQSTSSFDVINVNRQEALRKFA